MRKPRAFASVVLFPQTGPDAIVFRLRGRRPSADRRRHDPPLLRPDWAALALNLFRKPRIIEICRDGRLRKVDQVVDVEGPLERGSGDPRPTWGVVAGE